MASDKVFREDPYYDKLFAAYNRLVYGERKNKQHQGYQKDRDSKLFDVIMNYGRDDKTNSSKAYGFIDVSEKVLIARVAIIRLLSLSKDMLTGTQIMNIIGCNEETGKTLISQKIFDNAMQPMVKSGMVIRSGNKYRLSTDIFESIDSKHVYAFLNFIDHALPFTGIIHSLYASYDVSPAHKVLGPDGEELNKESDLYKIKKIDHISINQVMVEYALWTMLSAYSEKKLAVIRYFAEDGDSDKELNDEGFVKACVIPIRAVYDNLHSRLHIFAYNTATCLVEKYNAERIVSIELPDKKIADVMDEDKFKTIVEEFDESLKTAWTVCGKRDNKTENVTITFKNTFMVKNRLYNECRHGLIEEDKDRLILKLELNEIGEIKPWIRTFGSNVIDASPQRFKEDLKKGIEETLEFYDFELF